MRRGIHLSKRQFLKTALKASLLTGMPFPLFKGRVLEKDLLAPQKSAESTPFKALSLYNIHTHEVLKNCEFWQNGQFCPDGLTAINQLCRDHRSNKVHPIDPSTLLILHKILQILETKKLVHIVSGYRCEESNQLLRQQTQGVARNSYHTKGQALDFYVPDLSLRSLHKAALSLKAGGVGGYNHFIHIDTGPIRQWGHAPC